MRRNYATPLALTWLVQDALNRTYVPRLICTLHLFTCPYVIGPCALSRIRKYDLRTFITLYEHDTVNGSRRVCWEKCQVIAIIGCLLILVQVHRPQYSKLGGLFKQSSDVVAFCLRMIRTAADFPSSTADNDATSCSRLQQLSQLVVVELRKALGPTWPPCNDTTCCVHSLWRNFVSMHPFTRVW